MPTSDSLLPDRFVAERYGKSLRTLDRWDRDPRMAELGWPKPRKIRERKYRSIAELDAFDARLRRIAIEQREQLTPDHDVVRP